MHLEREGPMSEIVIRPPLASERERFYEVYVSGLPGVDEISLERYIKWWNRCEESGDLENLWRVAVLNDEIVGIVINVFNSELNWGFVWELAVVPEHRQKGIGSQLVEQSEQLLLEYSPSISNLAIGVKTDNLRALALYEKMGYSMYYLIIRLRGLKWTPNVQPDLTFLKPESTMVDTFLTFSPDAYWGTRNRESWTELVEQEGYAIADSGNTLVGFVRFIVQEGDNPHTEIPFHIRTGFGTIVLDACMEKIESDIVELWVQNNHQDVLEHLYARGFKRIESEFLLRKSVE